PKSGSGFIQRSRSVNVKTRTTPGAAAAAAVSIRTIRACAWGERRNAAWSKPGRITSSMNRPSPRRNRGSSRRFTAAPKNFAPITEVQPATIHRLAGRGIMSVVSLTVRCFALSTDGYGAGPSQDLQNPLGVRGPELMEWLFQTRVWRTMHGEPGGDTGVDNEMAEHVWGERAMHVFLRKRA